MYFGSDNHCGAHPLILDAITEANGGFEHGYGDDQWTQNAHQAFKNAFDCDLTVHFVATGTAANCLALSCMVQPWDLILCHEDAHIILDENTAPEFFTGGARMVAISQGAGKLTPDHIHHYFKNAGTEPPHNSQAKVLSFSQSTENGLVYSVEELTTLCATAKQYGLCVHMDGARFSNAVVSQQCTPAELSWQSGVDVLTLGATKNGALCAESVVFFNQPLAETFEQRRKRSGHLVSKGRLMGAQFLRWLQNDAWLDWARIANSQAQTLASQLQTIEGVRLAWPVQANELFVILPKPLSESLMRAGADYYEWPVSALPQEEVVSGDETYVRFVTSFATTDAQVSELIRLAKKYHNENI